MTAGFDDEDAVWRRCEVAWSAWLEAEHYAVMHLGEAVGNMRTTRAPLISVGGKRRRAPDLQTTKARLSEYWEVKFRTRSELDPLTGERVHWMEYAAFRDYLAIAENTNCRVWVVLYEAPTSLARGRWLRAEIRELRDWGQRGGRKDHGGNTLEAWVWPVSSMEVVPGPTVDTSKAFVPLLPNEGEATPLAPEVFEPMERQLRGRRPKGSEIAPSDGLKDRASSVLDSDYTAGLDVLRRSLGIPAIPRYSVLRVAGSPADLDDLLGLLQYGIRVFLVTREEHSTGLDSVELQAFKDARLLEWAVLPDLGDQDFWVVDGRLPQHLPTGLDEALRGADQTGAINVGQYRIVHADPSANVLVTAGAGAGKTETMSERLLFLLATNGGGEPVEGCKPYDLRVDDVVLMTFTREAAREMRDRIARTLMLRQRLARRCALPALAWMMQLSGADVTTIHGYAKRIAQAGAGALGLSPSFSVSRQTLAFRQLLHEALSSRIEQMLEAHLSDDVPAVHLWQRHIEAVWEALGNNGVDLVPLAATPQGASQVDWGSTNGGKLQLEVVDATAEVVKELSASFQAHCLANQSLPTSSLVPAALATLRSQSEPPVDRPKYLFVDEFQDTDALQMELVLEISQKLQSRLFVVGDAKQGIYRFRGAEGNAFEELRKRVSDRRMPPLADFSLTRNFRSGPRLLDSLHPYFLRWGEARLLTYGPDDRLRPRPQARDSSCALTIEQVRRDDFTQRAARTVQSWRQSGPGESIAVLCRRNWQAIAIQQAVRESGIPCELLVGGSFFTSPAVRELRALLEAVSAPSDDAALLELCETRWAAGIKHGQAPAGVGDAAWRHEVAPIISWPDRIGSLGAAGSFARTDLVRLRERVSSLKDMLSRMSVIAWIVECGRTFVPEGSALPLPDDDTERARYSRCFDHLITLLDAQFADSPATLERLLAWLRLQIATNKSEDEPVEWQELAGRTTALTVHKAKGLEFDRVLIPNTWTSFAPPKSVATQAALLRQDGQDPRLLWQWRVNGGKGGQFSNVPSGEQDLWRTNEHETAREETRLLYVALTRAKEELRVFVTGAPSSGRSPDTWGDLIMMGRP